MALTLKCPSPMCTETRQQQRDGGGSLPLEDEVDVLVVHGMVLRVRGHLVLVQLEHFLRDGGALLRRALAAQTRLECRVGPGARRRHKELGVITSSLREQRDMRKPRGGQ